MVDLGLDGKRVVVTGGTRGLGRATALAFARCGARVVAAYRSDDAGRAELVDRDGWDPRRDHTVRADLSTVDGVDELMRQCRQHLGGIDVLINNIGSFEPIPFAQLMIDQWRYHVDSNLTVHYLVTRAARPLLSEGSAVINVGAAMWTRGMPAQAHYTAAKGGLVGMTRSLSREFGPERIRVCAITPGVIRTERGVGVPQPLRGRYLAATALGRFGTAEEISRTVLFLASDLASFVTGITLNVDGGI
jgi:NAD(P)-dependent dehydrogenase (short-subunit alcohol dehydrogenase family)